jgi:hypothetical protein
VEINQAQIAHLQIIQGVITRMAGNSFTLKTLAVTLTAGLIALMAAIQQPSPLYPLAAFLPVIVFWWLDARYLQLERLYRVLYEHVRLNRLSEPFSMGTEGYRNQVATILDLMTSWSVVSIYATLLGVLVIVGAAQFVAGK